MVGGSAGHLQDPLQPIFFLHGADVHEGFQEVFAAGKLDFFDGFEDGDFFTGMIEHAAFGMIDILMQIGDGALPGGYGANKLVADFAEHVCHGAVDYRGRLGIDVNDAVPGGIDDDGAQQQGIQNGGKPCVCWAIGPGFSIHGGASPSINGYGFTIGPQPLSDRVKHRTGPAARRYSKSWGV
jgi:hypothetical protein